MIPAKARLSPRDLRNTAPATVSRFDYQARCAALTIVDHMSTGDLLAVIVENSTDLITVPVEGPPTLVSIKHREPSQVDSAEWTLSGLKKQRALHGLYEAWVEADRSCMVAFWSNAGMTNDARPLVDACRYSRHERDEKAAGRLVPKMAQHLNINEAEARGFLSALHLQQELLPRRNEIDDVAIRRVGMILAENGRSQAHAQDCWEWLLRTHVEPASRDPAQSPAFRAATLGAALRSVAQRLDDMELAFRYLSIADLRVGLLHEADRRDADRVPTQRAWAADPLFVGRDQELQRLADLVKPGGVDPVAPVVIHGIAGCGKSSLALHFAAVHAQRLRTVVVDASTRAGVIAGLEALSLGSNPVGDPRGLADLRGPLAAALPAGSASLLILDGVTQAEAIRGLIPRSGLCRVLITSTVPYLDDGFGAVPLRAWERADTKTYLEQGLAGATGDECDALADHLYDHPLAVCQAVNYCRTVGIGISSYLERLRAAPSRVLARGEAAGHPVSIVQAVRLAFAAAGSRNPQAIALLAMIAHLGAGPVRLELFDAETFQATADTYENARRAHRRWRRKDRGWPRPVNQELTSRGAIAVDQVA